MFGRVITAHVQKQVTFQFPLQMLEGNSGNVLMASTISSLNAGNADIKMAIFGAISPRHLLSNFYL